MKFKIRKRYFVGIILSLAVMYGGWKLTPPATPHDAAVALLPTVTMQIGARPFTLEVADEPVEMEIGLMHRKHMDDDHGMAFLFGQPPRVVTFWMKNTLIPLDLLFIDDAGTIAHIHHRAVPGDLTPISSKSLVTTVIEINGGLAEKYGIHPGDKIDLSAILKTQKISE